METAIDFTITILSFGVVGALSSALINVFKENLSKNKAKLLTIGFSLVVGLIGSWLFNSEYADAVVMVLGSASAVYGLILRDEKI
jgi:dolichol kinase